MKILDANALADVIREESKKAIAEFKKLGIKTIMLTGDNEKVTEVAGKIQSKLKSVIESL